MWRRPGRRILIKYTAHSSRSTTVNSTARKVLGIVSLSLLAGACAPGPSSSAVTAPNRGGRVMVGRNPGCEPKDSLLWLPTSYEEAAGEYALYVVSGRNWRGTPAPDSGRLVLVAPDSGDEVRACTSSPHCGILPPGGTDIHMAVEGRVGWLAEAWRGDSRMQSVYASLDTNQGSVTLQLGGALDLGVFFRGGFTDRSTVAGTWFSIVDEKLVNRGLWCAIRVE
jgi:hypothetical protein